MALQRVETDAIQDDAVTTAKIAANAVAAADIAADAITNAKVASNAAIAVSKITGLGTAATLTAGTSANNVVQLDGSGKLPAVNGANLTGVSTDTSAMENNIAILAFKTQSANNLAKFNLIDQVIDEYKDGTGVTLSTASQVGSTATDGYLATVYLISGYFTSDAQTSLLIQSNSQTNNSSTFTDLSSNGFTVATQGSPVHSTAQAKFGTSSIYLNGSSGLKIAWNAALQFDADWTIEFYMFPTQLNTGDRIISHWPNHHNNNGGQWFIRGTSDESDAVTIAFGSDVYYSTTGEKYTLNQWNHVAMQREGSNMRLFVNGVNHISSAVSTNTSGNQQDITIGYYNPPSPSEYIQNMHLDQIRISKGIARYSGTTTFTPPTDTSANNAAGTAISTANTALSAPTTGDICMLIENYAGTATLNTDLKAYVSRNGGTGWDQATLVDKGSWGSGTKKIVSANNVAFSNSASGTDIRYKIEWANQASGSKETRVHATSLAWA